MDDPPWVLRVFPTERLLGFACLFLTSPKAAYPLQQLTLKLMVTLFLHNELAGS